MKVKKKFQNTGFKPRNKKNKKRKNSDEGLQPCRESEANEIRKKQLLEANEEEDREIRRLEKLLKLNKRAKKGKKKIPSTFVGDGLDYLLEVIDRKEGDIFSDDSDFGTLEKEEVKPKRGLDTEQPIKQQRTLKDLMREKGIASDESMSDNADEGENEDDMSSEDELNEYNKKEDITDQEESSSGKKSSEEKEDCSKKPKIWEDIYGRFRDEAGNVIKNPNSEIKYVPPGLRKKSSDAQNSEKMMLIRRNLKGLLNRLSESNMQPISNQVEEMYMKNSRNDINETLFSLISEFVLTSVLTPPRLIIEQAMLVALLHANIGAEIGAFFLQRLTEKLDSLFKQGENYGEGKECNNVLIFLSHLYNFNVTHSTLIFDIFRKLIESFQSRDIELIQLFLKNIGFVLRKDDPVSLKEIILSIQSKAAAFKTEQNDSRVQFMLETLTAIRNNNIYKIPDYDPSIIEHSKKYLKGLVHKGCSFQELVIPYDDLLNADERGRWWIVGSAWAEKEDSKPSTAEKSQTTLPKSGFSEKILQLAQKQHMNTDVRKSVFCIIMTAEDYMDAFEKLLKLNLKNQQEREIVNVILHCVLQEKSYNPYYAYLSGKFCSFARKYLMSFQFSLWDKFKELSKLKPHQMSNLAQFLSHLFTSGSLPLSVLKVIHFSEMNKMMVSFFRKLLLPVLMHDSEEVCAQTFKRIAAGDNLKLLRESINLFMHHFMLRNLEKYTPEVAAKLPDRIKLAEDILNSSKKAFKL